MAAVCAQRGASAPAMPSVRGDAVATTGDASGCPSPPRRHGY